MVFCKYVRHVIIIIPAGSSLQLHRLAEMIWITYVATTDTLFLQEYLLFIARDLLRAPDSVCKTRQEGKTIY